MQPVRYQTRNEQLITDCVDFMRSVFSIPSGYHKVVDTEEGTRKACIQKVPELIDPKMTTPNHVAFIEGFSFMSHVLRIQDYDYSQDIVQYAGRVSAIHACNVVGLSREEYGLNG